MAEAAKTSPLHVYNYLFQLSSLIEFQDSGFKFQVSGFKIQVSSFKFQDSSFRTQVSGLFSEYGIKDSLETGFVLNNFTKLLEWHFVW